MDAASEYLFAARRKVEIARYHLASLDEELCDLGRSTSSDHGGLHVREGVQIPSVRLQAHFEGLLLAVDAIPDQIAVVIDPVGVPEGRSLRAVLDDVASRITEVESLLPGVERAVGALRARPA